MAVTADLARELGDVERRAREERAALGPEPARDEIQDVGRPGGEGPVGVVADADTRVGRRRRESPLRWKCR
jgi:hypothetical protein